MKINWPIVLSGFAGAVFPSMAELVSLCKTGALPSPSFYLGALLMGLMGTILVLVSKEPVPWKALMQGMGTPAFLSSAATATVATVAWLAIPLQMDVYAQTDRTVVVIVSPQQNPDIIMPPYCEKKHVGDKVVFFNLDSVQSVSYIVPDKDTVRLRIREYDPAIRRALFQGLMPAARNVTDKFAKRLVIEEIK